MTKKEFQLHCIEHGCTAHYQGSTQTMFVFGGTSNMIKVMGAAFKSGHRYIVDWLKFGVVAQATH